MCGTQSITYAEQIWSQSRLEHESLAWFLRRLQYVRKSGDLTQNTSINYLRYRCTLWNMNDDVNSNNRNNFLMIYDIIMIDDMKISIVESVTRSLCCYLQRDAALRKFIKISLKIHNVAWKRNWLSLWSKRIDLHSPILNCIRIFSELSLLSYQYKFSFFFSMKER